MKKPDTTTAPKPAAAAPKPAPVFNPATAIAVPPSRHEPTARTVAYVQPTADADMRDLFSATGNHILTVTAEHATRYFPAPVAAPAPAVAPAAADQADRSDRSDQSDLPQQ